MTENVEFTGKCFKCGAQIKLGKDGVYYGKECCLTCFVKYFRDREDANHDRDRKGDPRGL